MPITQKVFALVVCFFVFSVTLLLVRKGRLREEYSVLWLTTSLLMFVLVFRYDWLLVLTDLIGAALPTTTLFLGAIIFLMLIAVQFSIKLSRLTGHVKSLAQENTLLRAQLDDVLTRTASGKK